MRSAHFERVLEFFAGMELLVGLLWIGLVVFTLALLVLMRTRWGQYRPLRKCVVLSLLAHFLLVGYATTVRIVSGPPRIEESVVHVSFVDEPTSPSAVAAADVPQQQPWEKLPHDGVSPPEPIDPQRPQADPLSEPQRTSQAPSADLPGEPPLSRPSLAEVAQPEPEPMDVSGATGRRTPGQSTAQAIEVPTAQRREASDVSLPQQPSPDRIADGPDSQRAPARSARGDVPNALLEQLAPLPQLAAPATTPDPASSLAALTDRTSQPTQIEPARLDRVDRGAAPPEQADAPNAAKGPAAEESQWRPAAIRGPPDDPQDPGATPDEATVVVAPQRPRSREEQLHVPEIYRLRVAPNRARLAERQGASSKSEAAVRAALKWLAGNQKPDGRWDAGDHGAGRDLLVSGRNRQSAGIEADTGMTGLALLAMLASGHTHRDGPYRENVRLGLQYLLRSQADDGNLGGRATAYARMYCHSMATFALSEAYGMTGDDRLRSAVQRAIDYTIAAQDPTQGGWRYKPGDPGDTSQCGWQLMALKSAELAGFPIPVRARNGLIRFLRSVGSGRHGGLAAYRPNERVTRPMTAEALVCWQFLGMPREHPAGNEAGDYLLGEVPGQGRDNLYYWYYATLAMYQLQGDHWSQWNEALSSTLLARQRTSGTLAGSWDPDTVWGGYGGRVYSTALATLCLEVYYRFLPLYAEAAGPDKASVGVDNR